MTWTNHVICAYRIHGGQMVNSAQKQKETTLAVLDKFFTQPDLPSQLRRAHKESYASVYLEGAFREYGADQIDFAGESLTKAIVNMPKLVEGSRPPLVDVLISWAVNPVTGDPTLYTERVLDNLPPAATCLKSLRQQLLYGAVIQAVVEANLVQNYPLARRYLRDAWLDGNRLDANPELALELLINSVKRQSYETGLDLVEVFFAHLPAELAGLDSLRRKALARLHVARGFTAHQNGTAKEAGQALWQGVRRDPRWLSNRGVWKIMLKALKGSLFGG